jgi:hypothetical protein
MSTPKFTPGSLSVKHYDHDSFATVYARSKSFPLPHKIRVADVYADPEDPDFNETVKANAHLFKAAPDLYAACKDALLWIAGNTPLVDSFEASYGAIADEADAIRAKLHTALAAADGDN